MPAFYVPARDTRHRVACIALYRALLRQVPRLTLPDDLNTPARPGWTSPILYLVRSGFKRNKNDTSPRLITSALKNGYRFLALLTRAHDASSPQHSEIVSFLRERQAKFPPAPPQQEEVEATDGKEATDDRRKGPRIALLTKVSEPDSPYPVYEPTVRPLPLDQLSGERRKVPHVELAQNFPFLRVGKPQSHALANVLRRKNMRRQKRITEIIEFNDVLRPEARLEDQWEEILEKQAARERVDLEEGESAAVAENDDDGVWVDDDEEDERLAWLMSSNSNQNSMSMDPEASYRVDDFAAAALADDGNFNFDNNNNNNNNTTKNKGKKGVKNSRKVGPYESTVRDYGFKYLQDIVDVEVRDNMARTAVLVDLVREEQRLADMEKMQKKERRRRAWEEKVRNEKTQEQGQKGPEPTS